MSDPSQPDSPSDDTPPALWHTEERERALTTPIFHVERVRRTHPMRQSTANFWCVSPPDWANILAITPDGQLVLVEQYRHGTNRLTWEIPGGALDPSEDPLLAAQRELREETGFESSQWIKLGEIAVNPAFMTNRCSTWLATNATRSAPQAFDEHEELRVALCPIDTFFERVDRGEIDHGIVVSAAYYLKSYLLTRRGTP